MWSSLIFLFISFYFNRADDNIAEIGVVVNRNNGTGDLQCSGSSLGLEVHKPFRVHVYYLDYNNDSNIYRPRCFRSSSPNELLVNNFWKERVGYTSEFITTGVSGNLSYTCEMYTHNCFKHNLNKCYYSPKYEDDGVKCSFNIQVLKPEEIITGYLTTNNDRNFSLPGKYSYFYKFYDGEAVNFTCYKISGAYTKISYTSKVGTKISTGYQAGPSSLYIKLTAADNQTTIECSISNEHHEKSIDMLLISYPRNEQIPGFEVNGLILPLISKKENPHYFYEYRYYSDEKLTFAIVKDDLHKNVVCDAYGPSVPVRLRDLFTNNNMILANPITVVMSEECTDTYVTCTMKQLYSQQSTSVKLSTITFIHKPPDYEPFISGLSMARILMKYSNDTDTVIHYDYNGNETLNLKCTPSDREKNISWFYSEQAVKTPSPSNYIQIRPFTLQPDRNNTTIVCYTRDDTTSSVRRKSTHLMLIRKIGLVETPLPALEVTPVPGPVKETTPKNTGGPSPSPPAKNTTETVQRPPLVNTEDANQKPSGEGAQPEPKGNVETAVQPPQQNNKSENRTPKMIPSTEVKSEKPRSAVTTKKPVSYSKKKTWQPSKRFTTRRPISFPTQRPTSRKPTAPPTQKPTAPPTQKPIAPSSQKPTASSTQKPTAPSTQTPTAPFTRKQTAPYIQKLAAENPVEPVIRSSDESVTAHAIEVETTAPMEKETDRRMGIIVGAAAVIIIAIVVILWIAVDLITRRKKHRNNPSDIDYQNLPQHNEGPMSTLPQWDTRGNETYAVPNTRNLDNLYSKPVPKSMRNTKLIEPTYAEACDSKMAEPTYALVHSEPAYASVQNANAPNAYVQEANAPNAHVHNTSAPNAPIQEPTYSEISKTEYQNLEELLKIKQLESELTYAEIQTGGSSKPVINPKPIYSKIVPKGQLEQKYANIQDIKEQHGKLTRRGYANVPQREVEPAYCEVVNKN